MEYLEANSACFDGKQYYDKIGEPTTLLKTIQQCVKDDKFNYANWLMSRCLDRDDRTRCAIFAAEQVLGIYEGKCPNDDRPRKAIEAAKECLKDNSGENKKKARDAAAAAAYAYATATAAAAYTADDTAAAAAAAAYATAYTADDTATAYDTAAYAAAAAAYTADDTARRKLRIDILNYGLELAGYKQKLK